MKKPKPLSLVHIVWRDAGGVAGWHDYAPSRTMDCDVCGIVVPDAPDDRITLALSMAREKGWCRWHSTLEICWESVTKVTVLGTLANARSESRKSVK